MLNPANATKDRRKDRLANMPSELIECVKQAHPNGWIVYFTPQLCRDLHKIYKRYSGKFSTTQEAVAYTRRCLSKAARLNKFGVKSNGMQIAGKTIEEGFIIENEQ